MKNEYIYLKRNFLINGAQWQMLLLAGAGISPEMIAIDVRADESVIIPKEPLKVPTGPYLLMSREVVYRNPMGCDPFIRHSTESTSRFFAAAVLGQQDLLQRSDMERFLAGLQEREGLTLSIYDVFQSLIGGYEVGSQELQPLIGRNLYIIERSE